MAPSAVAGGSTIVGASRTGIDGQGLGLAIAQRVVQVHGGEIVATNRDGGGLQVTITLPPAGR